MQSRLPLPWLHIAEVVAAHALERRFKCLGLMGTRWLVSGEVYPAKLEPLGIAYVRPDRAEREVARARADIVRVVMAIEVAGRFLVRMLARRFFRVFIEIHRQGAGVRGRAVVVHEREKCRFIG